MDSNSIKLPNGVTFTHLRTIGAAVAHFLDMEGVTGSIPVSSTVNAVI
jgi:hypothetical protein